MIATTMHTETGDDDCLLWGRTHLLCHTTAAGESYCGRCLRCGYRVYARSVPVQSKPEGETPWVVRR